VNIVISRGVNEYYGAEFQMNIMARTCACWARAGHAWCENTMEILDVGIDDEDTQPLITSNYVSYLLKSLHLTCDTIIVLSR
jgi:hypothetical protein